eukprot:COSAG02_NODE_753_length_17610_cov_23.119753_2_plen_47_part_00
MIRLLVALDGGVSLHLAQVDFTRGTLSYSVAEVAVSHIPQLHAAHH